MVWANETRGTMFDSHCEINAPKLPHQLTVSRDYGSAV
jgi:hypothetical protein